jgi:hypothetical protein
MSDLAKMMDALDREEQRRHYLYAVLVLRLLGIGRT